MLKCVPDELKTKEMCEIAVSSNGLSVEYVPSKLKTRDVCLLASQQNPLVMKKIPSKYLSAPFCLSVIEKVGNKAVELLPISHKNEQFYSLLIKSNPELIWHLPQRAHTAKISKLAIKSMGFRTTADAIKRNPSLLSQLHTSLYDYDTCLVFAQSDFLKSWSQNGTYEFCGDGDIYMGHEHTNHYSLKHILRWYDVCELIIPLIPRGIAYVKKEILSNDLCLMAVKADGDSLRDIPDEFKTQKICSIAFEQNPYLLEIIPKEFVTYEMCLMASREKRYILKYIPEKYRSKEVCLAAVRNQGTDFEYVPKACIDEDICIAAIQSQTKTCYKILDKIPDELRTYEVCFLAMKADSSNFEFVPEIHKTYEICLLAAKGHSFDYGEIPDEYFTEELSIATINRFPSNIKLIPKQCLTEKICLYALNERYQFPGMILAEIPRALMTQEMCDLAMRSTSSISAVPDEFVTKDMLRYVAELTPALLALNFPERFRTEEFINELIESFPDSDSYIRRVLE